MNVDLKATIRNEIEKFLRHRVPILWHNLKGGAKPESFIHIHEVPAKLFAIESFNIVRDDETALALIGPKPDERHLLNAVSAHGERHQFALNTIYCAINRPLRKRNLLPITQMNLLQMLAKRYRKTRAQ